jgi:hypothetical protein
MAATYISERINPSRFPNGVGNVARRDTFGMLGQPDHMRYHAYENDFDRYGATEWTVTLVGTGTAALTNADGGELLVSTTAGATDSVQLQKLGESFLMEPGKPAFFKCRLKMSDTNLCALAIGLQVTTAAPLNPTQGVYFVKASGSTNLTGVVRQNAGALSLSTGTLASLVNATYYTLGFVYDGKTEVQFYVNDIQAGSLPGTPNATGVASIVPFLPNTTLAPCFAIVNGAAATKTLNLDYISALKFRGTARP